MEIYEVKNTIVRASWDLILSYHLSAIDAIQVITAQRSNSDLFLAADKYLLSQADVIGLNTCDVEKSP